MRSPEEREQYNNLVDALGFDPETGQKPRIQVANRYATRARTVEEDILGFDILSGERVLPKDSRIQDDPRFADFFVLKATESEYIGNNKRIFTNPYALFCAVDDGFNVTSRRYHYVNPNLSLESQLLTVEAFVVFERLGRWGQNPSADGYRLMRVGFRDIEKGTSQTVEFDDENIVTIELKGGEWGSTSVVYGSGKLKSAKFSNDKDFCRMNFQNTVDPICKFPAGERNILIPNYLTSHLPTDLFIKNPSFEDDPFGVDISCDDEWKTKDIISQFQLRFEN